jgi:Na+/H+-dicarboxylate symporter
LFFLLSILTALLIAFWGHPLIPIHIKSFFLSVSLCLKDLFLLLMPFIMSIFLLTSLKKLGSNAFRFAIFFVIFIIGSNFFATMTSYGVSQFFLKKMHFSLVQESYHLEPTFLLSIPKMFKNEHAFLSTIIFFVLGNYFFKHKRDSFIEKSNQIIKFFLEKILSPTIPIFIFGFALKMAHENTLALIFENYFKVLIFIISSCFFYIFIMYIVGCGAIKKTFKAVSHMCPAMLSGLTTASSALSLPSTIMACEKNTSSPLVRAILPLSSNIHLIGDCFSIIIIALALRVSFGLPDVSFLNFFVFAIFFVLNKFAVAGVPGGGVLIMLPILEKYLGFSPDMLSLISGIYILFDPIVTMFNILGNGAFSMIFIKFFKRFEK